MRARSICASRSIIGPATRTWRALSPAASAGRASTAVLDLGCGTGSNLRATAPLLGRCSSGPSSTTTRILLAAAISGCAVGPATAERDGSRLLLSKDGKRIWVRFASARISAHDLDGVLGDRRLTSLTASALFDLVNDDFIATVAASVARRRAAFFTVLTYNGVQRWTPKHEADAGYGRGVPQPSGARQGLRRRPPALHCANPPSPPPSTRPATTVIEGDSGWRLDAGGRIAHRRARHRLRGGRARDAAGAGGNGGRLASSSGAPAPWWGTRIFWPCPP